MLLSSHGTLENINPTYLINLNRHTKKQPIFTAVLKQQHCSLFLIIKFRIWSFILHVFLKSYYYSHYLNRFLTPEQCFVGKKSLNVFRSQSSTAVDSPPDIKCTPYISGIFPKRQACILHIWGDSKNLNGSYS